MDTPTVLIICDEADFSRRISARWQMERNVPTFTMLSGDLWPRFAVDVFDVAIVGAGPAGFEFRLCGRDPRPARASHRPTCPVVRRDAVQLQFGFGTVRVRGSARVLSFGWYRSRAARWRREPTRASLVSPRPVVGTPTHRTPTGLSCLGRVVGRTLLTP